MLRDEEDMASEVGGKPEKDVLEAKYGHRVWVGRPTAPVTAAGPEKGPRTLDLVCGGW